MSAQFVTVNDAVGIGDVQTWAAHLHLAFANAVGVTDTCGETYHHASGVGPQSVGITNGLTYVLTKIPYDTWRPVLRRDNHLILACRTPVGEHDSPTGLTHMALWTFANNGAHEKVVATIGTGVPLAGSWTAFGHPEWSPDGTAVVVASETTTLCHISILDATGFGWS